MKLLDGRELTRSFDRWLLRGPGERTTVVFFPFDVSPAQYRANRKEAMRTILCEAAHGGANPPPAPRFPTSGEGVAPVTHAGATSEIQDVLNWAERHEVDNEG